MQDDDGFISVTEMRQFMATLYPSDDFTDEQLGRVIRTWDLDRDGRLSTNELAINVVVNQKKKK